MDFYAEVLRSKAPFIAANWAVAVIVGTLLIGAFVAFFCTKSKGSGEGSKTKENNLARQKPREKDDDPMVEFENSAPEAIGMWHFTCSIALTASRTRAEYTHTAPTMTLASSIPQRGNEILAH